MNRLNSSASQDASVWAEPSRSVTTRAGDQVQADNNTGADSDAMLTERPTSTIRCEPLPPPRQRARGKWKTVLRSSPGLAVAVAIAMLTWSAGEAATIGALSCSTADVQAAVNTASNGDTVLIPSGTCSWT